MIQQIKLNLYKIREGVYLKTTGKSESIIYPPKKDLNKPFYADNVNWKNFLIGGSWNRFITMCIIIAIICLISYGYYHDIKEYKTFYENTIKEPCKLCYYIQEMNQTYDYGINISLIKESLKKDGESSNII